MARVFNILKSVKSYSEGFVLNKYHESWRLFNKEGKNGFFAIFNEFEDKHLKDIEAGALKLYIYLGIHSNNTNGESWHSVETIAAFFDVQTRTVDYWVSNLSKRNLIYRAKSNHKTATTHLLPYSDTLLKVQPTHRYQFDSDELIANIVHRIEISANVTGKIKGVYHLFQWKTKVGIPIKEDNTQWLFIITERTNGIRVGSYYGFKTSIDFGVSKLELDDVYVFESVFKFNGVPLTGIAIPHTHQIEELKNRGHIREVIEDLSNLTEDNLKEFAILQYGEISKTLNIIDDSANTEETKTPGEIKDE
jgi:hypothetical protein